MSRSRPAAPALASPIALVAAVALLVSVLLLLGTLLAGCAGSKPVTTTLTLATTTSTTAALSTSDTPSSGHHPDTTAATFALMPDTTVATSPPPDSLGATSSSATPTSTSSTIAFGNTVNWGDEQITVWAAGLWGGTTAGVAKDREIQSVEVRIVNTDNIGGSIEYSFAHLEARDSEGFTYDASLKVQGQQLLGSGMLAPGKAVDGYVGFEIPKGNTLASVTYTPITYGPKPVHFTWEK